MFILEHKPSRYSFCPNYIKQSGAEKIFYNQQKDREILPWKRILNICIPDIPLSFGVVESDPPGYPAVFDLPLLLHLAQVGLQEGHLLLVEDVQLSLLWLP